MIFLFVGSSCLTEASFPQDLAIPQLLLSSACVILLPMKASQMTVFTHRGFAPHQLTPMTGAHNITAANAGGPCRLAIWAQRAGRIAEFLRSAARASREFTP